MFNLQCLMLSIRYSVFNVQYVVHSIVCSVKFKCIVQLIVYRNALCAVCSLKYEVAVLSV